MIQISNLFLPFYFYSKMYFDCVVCVCLRARTRARAIWTYNYNGLKESNIL